MKTRLFGALDLLLVGVYGWVGLGLVPSRSRPFEIALLSVMALLALAGVANLLGLRAARALGIVACSVVGFFGLAVMWLLVASAAYVRAVYAALGQGLAVLALIAALCVANLFLVVPLLQLGHHLKRPKTP